MSRDCPGDVDQAASLSLLVIFAFGALEFSYEVLIEEIRCPMDINVFLM